MTPLSPTTAHALLTVGAGFGLGFLGSVPITGPVALLVLSRAADRRYRTALQIGFGAACAEAFYAAIAYLGFGAIRAHRPELMSVARAISAVALTIVGLIFLLRGATPRSSDRETPADVQRHGAMIGFSISAFNPTLFGTWAAAVAFLYARRWVELSIPLALPFGLAAGLGIACWELLFVLLLRWSEPFVLRRAMHRLVRCIGAVVLGLGLWSGFEALRALGLFG